MTSNEEKSPAIHISLVGTSDEDFLLFKRVQEAKTSKCDPPRRIYSGLKM